MNEAGTWLVALIFGAPLLLWGWHWVQDAARRADHKREAESAAPKLIDDITEWLDKRQW